MGSPYYIDQSDSGKGSRWIHAVDCLHNHDTDTFCNILLRVVSTNNNGIPWWPELALFPSPYSRLCIKPPQFELVTEAQANPLTDCYTLAKVLLLHLIRTLRMGWEGWECWCQTMMELTLKGLGYSVLVAWDAIPGHSLLLKAYSPSCITLLKS